MAKNNAPTAVKFTRKFSFERATKNTFRFQEDEVAGEAPIIGTLYVQKFPFNGSEPGSITVTVEQG